jgi:hypothetical protein
MSRGAFGMRDVEVIASDELYLAPVVEDDQCRTFHRGSFGTR